jgi:hypothetical protein
MTAPKPKTAPICGLTESQQRERLEETREFLDGATFAHARGVEAEHHKLHGDSDGGRCSMERRPKLRRELGKGDGQGGGGRHTLHPGGPADDKPADIAKSAVDIDIGAARARHGRGQLRDDIGFEARVHKREQPQCEYEMSVGNIARDKRRRAQDSDADHRPDCNGDPEGYTENLQKLSAPTGARLRDAVSVKVHSGASGSGSFNTQPPRARNTNM